VAGCRELAQSRDWRTPGVDAAPDRSSPRADRGPGVWGYAFHRTRRTVCAARAGRRRRSEPAPEPRGCSVVAVRPALARAAQTHVSGAAASTRGTGTAERGTTAVYACCAGSRRRECAAASCVVREARAREESPQPADRGRAGTTDSSRERRQYDSRRVHHPARRHRCAARGSLREPLAIAAPSGSHVAPRRTAQRAPPSSTGRCAADSGGVRGQHGARGTRAAGRRRTRCAGAASGSRPQRARATSPSGAQRAASPAR
jgi:hypothetical protein